jgi:hypothetical protein
MAIGGSAQANCERPLTNESAGRTEPHTEAKTAPPSWGREGEAYEADNSHFL